MVNYTILAGGYTTFVISYLFNSEAGALTIQSNSTTGENPSWIALHPTNNTILYATNENTEGALQSFEIGEDGSLSVLDTVSSGGDGPAFANPISTGQVAVMNFGSGDGRIIPTSSTDPSNFDDSAPVIKFPVPPSGQSHPHAAYQFNDEIFVPDLGADKIYRLAEDGSPSQWKITGSIDQAAGSGPRHLVLKDNKVFTLHELSSTLTIQTIPSDPNRISRLLASVSTVPTDGVPAGAKFAAAEVLYPPPLTGSGNNSYIYTSNRNTGEADPRGDSIAIFQHIPGDDQDATQKRWHKRTNDQLILVNQVFTGLQQIRGMQFSDDGQYLVAGGVLSGGVKVFQRTDGGENLVEVASNSDVDTRSSFVWV